MDFGQVFLGSLVTLPILYSNGQFGGVIFLGFEKFQKLASRGDEKSRGNMKDELRSTPLQSICQLSSRLKM